MQVTMEWQTLWQDARSSAGCVSLVVDWRAQHLGNCAPTAQDCRDALTYRQGLAREQFLWRRNVLRRLVARECGHEPDDVVIAHDAAGKPHVVSPPRCGHVSVAMRGDLAALAFARHPVGVDIETTGQPQEPAWNILHPRERAWLAGRTAASRHVDFLRLWTAKEAALKIDGRGLRREPSTIEIRLQDPDFPVIVDPQATTSIVAEARILAQGGGVVVTVAMSGSATPEEALRSATA